MGRTKIDLLREQLESARVETLATASRVPAAAELYQLGEGRPTPLWLIGHLANTTNTLILRWTLRGENLVSKEFSKLFAPDFGGGEPPTTDAAKYPSFAEVVQTYDTVMQAAIAGLGAVDDDILANPIPVPLPEPIREKFPNIGKTLQRAVAHDAYHRGQIGMLSKVVQ
jgi:hypothetical protein